MLNVSGNGWIQIPDSLNINMVRKQGVQKVSGSIPTAAANTIEYKD
jgi:hypothetical protein